jgi:hypothetical protein
MPKKSTSTKRKAAPARKPVVAKKVKAVASTGNKFWMTLVGLIAGGLAFIGYALLSNLTVTIPEKVQIATIFVLAVFAIAGVVFSVLALLLKGEGGTNHRWLGLNIIGLVVSFLMLEKFLSPLISVITYLFNK